MRGSQLFHLGGADDDLPCFRHQCFVDSSWSCHNDHCDIISLILKAEKQGLRRLAFMGEILESINGGLGVSERWIQQRPDQIRKMITGVFRGMAHARIHRQESIALVMSKWKMERDVAEKAFDLMLRTWSDNGQASDQALQAGIEESLKVSSSKQAVALSRVADFSFAREVYRELKAQ